MTHGNGSGNGGSTDRPLRGFIRSTQPSKGFGFLVGEDGTERFFHVSQLTGAKLEELKIGRPVTFSPEPDRGKGPRACGVMVLSS